MCCDENNRDLDACVIQCFLQVQPADARQSHIENETTGKIRPIVRQEFGGRAEEFSLQTDRPQKVFEGASHGSVVLNNEDLVLQLFHFAVTPTGSVKLKAAPLGDRCSAHNRPPCVSMIERLIVSPMPIPFFFVVKNGSKIELERSFGRPHPRSNTWTNTASRFFDDL